MRVRRSKGAKNQQSSDGSIHGVMTQIPYYRRWVVDNKYSAFVMLLAVLAIGLASWYLLGPGASSTNDEGPQDLTASQYVAKLDKETRLDGSTRDQRSTYYYKKIGLLGDDLNKPKEATKTFEEWQRNYPSDITYKDLMYIAQYYYKQGDKQKTAQMLDTAERTLPMQDDEATEYSRESSIARINYYREKYEL